MTSRDFCYWLQGFFELAKADDSSDLKLSYKKVALIERHLALVFKHEIDPSFGPDLELLSSLHATGGMDPAGDAPNIAEIERRIDELEKRPPVMRVDEHDKGRLMC